jgi:hypothetical protein
MRKTVLMRPLGIRHPAWGRTAGLLAVLSVAWVGTAAGEVLPLDVTGLAARAGSSPIAVAVNVDHAVDLVHAGTWTEAGGWSTWSYSVTVPGALSLGFHTTVALPETAKLRLLDGNGAAWKTYSSRTVSPQGRQLWSLLVPGDTLALELRVPTSDRAAAALSIGQISVGTKPSLLRARTAAETLAATPTQENWSCYASSTNTNAANATFMYTVQTTSVESGGTQSVINQCTATLVNDVPHDGRLFAMTAAHCAGESADVQPASLVAYWNAVSPCSSGLQSGQSVATATSNGAVTRALFNTSNGADSGDSWLLELDGQGVPANSDAYFAGWDATNRFSSGEPSTAFNINHSSGQSKQYADSTGGTDSSGTVSPFIFYDWQVGETLAGASGSGVFNQNQAVFGTLTSTVTTSNGPGGQFFALSSAWEGLNRADNAADSIQPWLDPSNTGTLVLGGQAPTPAPTIILSVSPSTVATGASYTVTWSSANASSCSGSGAWSGRQATSGTLTTSQVNAGTYNYVLTCSGPGGKDGDSAAVVVTSGGSGSSSGGASSSSGPGGSSGGGAIDLLALLGMLVAYLGRATHFRVEAKSWRG